MGVRIIGGRPTINKRRINRKLGSVNKDCLQKVEEAIKGEIRADKEAGNLEEDSGVDEDRLFDPKTGKPVKPDDGTNQDDI